MKCLSLWEPWAELIKTGRKKLETRSWGTKYRGPLAIHAAKKPPDKTACEDFGVIAANLYPGCIVCIVDLVDCFEFTHSSIGHASITPDERRFGNVEIGRYGWLMQLLKVIQPPIPVVGNRMLWEWPRYEWKDGQLQIVGPLPPGVTRAYGM